LSDGVRRRNVGRHKKVAAVAHRFELPLERGETLGDIADRLKGRRDCEALCHMQNPRP